MNIYNEIPKLNNTAVALGCFDGIHQGHMAVIQKVIGCGKLESTVFSFSDDVPYKRDSRRIITFEDKSDILSDIGVKNLVIPSFETLHAYPPEKFFREVLIDKLGARLIACGENYRFGNHAAGDVGMMQSMCAEYGIECRVASPVLCGDEPISSSRVRSALDNGDAELAEKMLGRLFSYKLEVAVGRHLGRMLGTPTINQYFPVNFIIPKYGVYASVTEIDGRKYHSVTNIGVKPTVGSDRPLSETWIPDFDGNLYGKFIRVSLVKFMREEHKFDSIEKLKEAIIADGVMSKGLTAKYV